MRLAKIEHLISSVVLISILPTNASYVLIDGLKSCWCVVTMFRPLVLCLMPPCQSAVLILWRGVVCSALYGSYIASSLNEFLNS